MRVLTEEQGTVEWFTARFGKVSASRAADVLAKRGTKRRALYLAQLADEINATDPEHVAAIAAIDASDESPWFRFGRAFENEARAAYCFERDTEVTEVGFCIADAPFEFVGASPDGLVAPAGGVEIKCRSSLKTFGEHCKKVTPVMPQIQTQIFVCGLEWVDYCNFWADEKSELHQLHVQRVYRDDQFIAELTTQFVLFWQEVLAVAQAMQHSRVRHV